MEIRVSITGKGKEKGFKVGWRGAINNDTGRDWYKVTFCITGFDADGNPLRGADGKCLIRMWQYQRKGGTRANWKGSQKIRIGDGTERRVELARFEISVEELRTDPESVHMFAETCERVWPIALQTFMSEKFRPTVSDKDSFVASFEYQGGQVMKRFGNANNLVKAYTSARTGFLTTWEGFRIDGGSLLLKLGADRGCRAEITMSFAGFEKGAGWYDLATNHQYEKGMLKKISERLDQAYEEDLDQAIPSLSAKPEQASPDPPSSVSLSITSDPTPADIEIDGVYVGSTASTLSVDPGQHTISVKKRGFRVWERQLRFQNGDVRTIHAELETAP